MSAPVRSSPHRWIFFVCPETVVILHREQTRPEAVMEDFGTSVRDSPPRIFPIARWERAVPLYAEKLFGIQKVLALRGWVAFPSHAT